MNRKRLTSAVQHSLLVGNAETWRADIAALKGEVSRFGVGLPLLRASEEVHAASTEADRISTNQAAVSSEARLNGEQIQRDRENVETSARWPWKSGVKS
ncbi:hypothetical protein VSR69_44975 [Paraburkholderia phytofirmans]